MSDDTEVSIALIASLKALESMPFDCPPPLQQEVQGILKELPAEVRTQLLEGQTLNPMSLKPIGVPTQLQLLRRCVALHSKALMARKGEPRDTKDGKGYSYYEYYDGNYGNGEDYEGYDYYSYGGGGGECYSEYYGEYYDAANDGAAGGGRLAPGQGGATTRKLTNAPSPMTETWPPVLCRVLLETLRALRALANPGDSAEEDAVQLLEMLPDAARKELVVNEGKHIGPGALRTLDGDTELRLLRLLATVKERLPSGAGMSEEGAASLSSALVLALDTLRQMPFSPTDAGLPQKDMKAFIDSLPANLKERLKSSTRRLLPDDLWTLPITAYPPLLCRAVELLVASLKMVVVARDEMASALADSLVTAVCLPFVMPPKITSELRKVCLKLPPAANELLANHEGEHGAPRTELPTKDEAATMSARLALLLRDVPMSLQSLLLRQMVALHSRLPAESAHGADQARPPGALAPLSRLPPPPHLPSSPHPTPAPRYPLQARITKLLSEVVKNLRFLSEDGAKLSRGLELSLCVSIGVRLSLTLTPHQARGSPRHRRWRSRSC